MASSHSRPLWHKTPWQAIGFMVASTACFSLMNTLIRFISPEMHSTYIVFIRNFICVFLLLPLVLRERAALLNTTRLSSHFWRSAVGIIGMESWFYAVTILPLNQATALSYTAPLFTSLFAVLFLKEVLSRARLMALLVGFIGAMIILNPSVSAFDARALIVLFATSMWAIAGMLVKSLTRTEPALRIVFFMSCFMSLLSLPLALIHWHYPTPHQWLVLLAIAASSILAQWLLARAYALADVTSVMPYDFGRLIFTGMFAFVAFGELVDPRAWVGAAIIVVSTVLLARYEARLRNRC